MLLNQRATMRMIVALFAILLGTSKIGWSGDLFLGRDYYVGSHLKGCERQGPPVYGFRSTKRDRLFPAIHSRRNYIVNDEWSGGGYQSYNPAPSQPSAQVYYPN